MGKEWGALIVPRVVTNDASMGFMISFSFGGKLIDVSRGFSRKNGDA